MTVKSCPLCYGNDTRIHHEDPHRTYRSCETCALIFVPHTMHVSSEQEVLRYLEHRNSGDDERYVAFLRRLADPLAARLTPGQRGLDFGCGPAPVLAELLSVQGFPTAAYDPFFAPDAALLEARYDFIACSEVVEHLQTPGETFAQFDRLLTPRGRLGIMTRFFVPGTSFADWWYRRDPTHVCFYGEQTMRWIAGRYRWTVEFPVPDVAIFSVA